jgi:hypothetical protein
MNDWAEPQNFTDWAKRIFSLRSILMGLLVCFIFISELRFDWIERVLGAYLATTNLNRPESGAIWDVDRKATTAQQALEQIVTDRQTLRREALGAASFAEIASHISLDQGVMVSSDLFRSLYLKLPREIAQEIASPFELLSLFNDVRLDRAYFTKTGDEVEIYLLDFENHVLKKFKIGPDLLYLIQQIEAQAEGPLENLPNFTNRIYLAERFFEALDSLSEQIRRGIISQPEQFLKISGSITRVGISDEAVSGFIALGLEVEDASGTRVILIQAREWAVWPLRSQLEDKGPDVTTLDSFKNER